MDRQRKASINERRKKQIVQNWLSSFVVTSVVVVAAVMSPTTVSASANILNLESIGTSIFYQVEVLDEGNTLEADSLKIIAKSNIESVEESLEIGQDSGVFYDLRPNTEYTVSVVGSAGFGSYTLTEQTVQTKNEYIPQNAIANFLSLESVGSYIYYTVEIIDIDNTLSSLSIIADSGTDFFIQELTLGQNEGVFDALTEDTEYIISVVGFGNGSDYTLAEQEMRTAKDYSGQIVSADISEDTYGEMFKCDTVIEYSEYNDAISEVKLKYRYIIIGQQEQKPEYIEVLVTDQSFTYIIENIPKITGYLEIILEATLSDNQVIILDEEIINSPFVIYAGAYVNYVSETFIEAFVYPDNYLEDATYYATITLGGVILDQKDITIEFYQENYSMGYLFFNNLTPLTEYTIEFYIQYTNPNTFVQETQLFESATILTEQYMAY